MKEELHIRRMEERDEEALREIIWKADPAGEAFPWPELIYTRWGEHYFQNNRHHCFVAVRRSDDRAVGYILCAPDTSGYRKDFNRRQYREVRSLLRNIRKQQPGAVRKYRLGYYRLPEGFPHNLIHPVRTARIYRAYPAHLHINIHPDYQRRGIGHLLVRRLLDHLAEQGIPGVHLIVGADNRTGIGFYRKYGFTSLLKMGGDRDGGIFYGLRTSGEER